MHPDGGGHIALFYRAEADYLSSVATFIEAGLAAGEAAFIAVPGPKISPLQDTLGAQASSVAFADMTEMGRNPAWIIPRVQEFIDSSAGRPVRYVGEPIWAERTPGELREATRHEALINLAFSGAPATILCPYDTRRLSRPVLADAECTHPALQRSGEVTRSGRYCGPDELPPEVDGPLAPGPPDAASLTYRADLSGVRALAGREASRAGLPPRRAADLVLAVSEIAANTIRHTGAHGTLRVWHDPREVVCELSDPGHIEDPLAGRRRPVPGSPGGHGLWITHQACDLVELRSGPRGTTIRLHMDRGAGRLPQTRARRPWPAGHFKSNCGFFVCRTAILDMLFPAVPTTQACTRRPAYSHNVRRAGAWRRHRRSSPPRASRLFTLLASRGDGRRSREHICREEPDK
jgi:anti-sigma regulatory factor (Ser/Thr protein kinase)